jgi:hypothetical protein
MWNILSNNCISAKDLHIKGKVLEFYSLKRVCLKGYSAMVIRLKAYKLLTLVSIEENFILINEKEKDSLKASITSFILETGKTGIGMAMEYGRMAKEIVSMVNG